MTALTPIPFWEYFDIISLSVLAVVITGLLVTHRKKNGNLLSSISKTVAYSPRTSLIFSVVMTIFFPLYYAFLWFWVGPLLQMPSIYYILLFISALSEMTFVWVPARGKTYKAHAVAAAYVGLTMLLLPIIILAYGVGLTFTGLAFIYAFLTITLGVITLLTFRGMRKYTLHFEILFCTAFLVTMSMIAHS